MFKKLSIITTFTTATTAAAMAATGTLEIPTCGWYFVGWAYAYGCW